MRKWYNFETLSKELRDGLRNYLKDVGIKYELSSCYDGWHFEIYATKLEFDIINRWLDNYYDTMEKGVQYA